MKLAKLLYEILEIIRKNAGGLWWFGQHHPPLISPNVYQQMQYYRISYKELIGAFHSSRIETGYKTGSTCGIANYYGKVVGAVYKRDDKDQSKWVIIACWAYHKKISDSLSGRRYWESWKHGPPQKWRR